MFGSFMIYIYFHTHTNEDQISLFLKQFYLMYLHQIFINRNKYIYIQVMKYESSFWLKNKIIRCDFNYHLITLQLTGHNFIFIIPLYNLKNKRNIANPNFLNT